MNKINRLRKQLTQRDHYQSHYKYVGLKSAIITSPSIISLVPCLPHFLLNQLLWERRTYTLIISVCALNSVFSALLYSNSHKWKEHLSSLLSDGRRVLLCSMFPLKVKTTIYMLCASKSWALFPPCWHIKFSKMEKKNNVSYSWISINTSNFPLLPGFWCTCIYVGK